MERMTMKNVCDRTWKADMPAGGDEPNIYRQHRCEEPPGHTGVDVCGYCGQERGAGR